jgi:transcriptional antiterminator
MPFEFYEQQNEACNCNDVISIIKRSSFEHFSKNAIAQISPGNQTIQHPKKDYYIASDITAIDITQLKDELRSKYPLLDAIANRIQTMDATETLRYTTGVEIVHDLLQSHTAKLLMNQTAGSQTGTP